MLSDAAVKPRDWHFVNKPCCYGSLFACLLVEFWIASTDA